MSASSFTAGEVSSRAIVSYLYRCCNSEFARQYFGASAEFAVGKANRKSLMMFDIIGAKLPTANSTTRQVGRVAISSLWCSVVKAINLVLPGVRKSWGSNPHLEV